MIQGPKSRLGYGARGWGSKGIAETQKGRGRTQGGSQSISRRGPKCNAGRDGVPPGIAPRAETQDGAGGGERWGPRGMGQDGGGGAAAGEGSKETCFCHKEVRTKCMCEPFRICLVDDHVCMCGPFQQQHLSTAELCPSESTRLFCNVVVSIPLPAEVTSIVGVSRHSCPLVNM